MVDTSPMKISLFKLYRSGSIFSTMMDSEKRHWLCAPARPEVEERLTRTLVTATLDSPTWVAELPHQQMIWWMWYGLSRVAAVKRVATPVCQKREVVMGPAQEGP